MWAGVQRLLELCLFLFDVCIFCMVYDGRCVGRNSPSTLPAGSVGSNVQRYVEVLISSKGYRSQVQMCINSLETVSCQ